MRAVDTNVLVRLITRDDPRQVAAAETFVAGGAWVPHLAVAEAAWVLESVYFLDAAAIATAVDMLLNHEQLTVQDSEVVAAALEQFRRHPRVGFSDCLMVEIARKAGHTPLGTVDRALGKVDGAHQLRGNSGLRDPAPVSAAGRRPIKGWAPHNGAPYRIGSVAWRAVFR